MSNDGTPGAPHPSGPLERGRVVEQLCDHYAADHLDLPEFERRVDRAHRAGTQAELQAILAGLPALSPESGGPPAPRTGATAGATGTSLSAPGAGTGTPAQHPRGWVALEPGTPVATRQTEIAVFSGRVRQGGWIPARRILGIALMGGIELDFREARFPPGVTQVSVLACMGGVDIVVPPGVRVETEGFAILGGFDEAVDGTEGAEPDAPVLRITGFALLGGVDVTCRYPGETPRQAKRRRKEQGRLRAEEHRRRLGSGD